MQSRETHVPRFRLRSDLYSQYEHERPSWSSPTACASRMRVARQRRPCDCTLHDCGVGIAGSWQYKRRPASPPRQSWTAAFCRGPSAMASAPQTVVRRHCSCTFSGKDTPFPPRLQCTKTRWNGAGCLGCFSSHVLSTEPRTDPRAYRKSRRRRP